MFVFSAWFASAGLHKAKLGSQIKKLFCQFHYFSKAAAHITQDIAQKPFFRRSFCLFGIAIGVYFLKSSCFGSDIEII